MKRFVLCYLPISLLVLWSTNVIAANQIVTGDVVSQSTNPDFVLDDTTSGDVDWAIEIDEPESGDFSISQGTWG